MKTKSLCRASHTTHKGNPLQVIDAHPQRREVRKHIVFTIALLCALGVAWYVRHVLGIVYVAGLFAVVLNPIVLRIAAVRIRNWRVGKVSAVIILVVSLLGALTLFLWLGLPPVLRDFRNFAGDVPERIPSLLARLKHLPMADKLGADDIAHRIQGSAGTVASYIVSSLPLWAEHLLDILSAAILTVYFILEGPEAYGFFLSLVPSPSRVRLGNTLLVAEERVSRWLLGQLLLMAAVAVYSLVVYRILNVRYFILLGVLMGLTNIIPIAGNLITVILVALIAAIDSWTKAGLVIASYAIYTQFENAYLTPRIMKSSVDLTGTSVLIGLMAGTAISGIPGALVAVPTAAIIEVFACEYLVQRDDPDRASLIP